MTTDGGGSARLGNGSHRLASSRRTTSSGARGEGVSPIEQMHGYQG
jgi:hypothetical protein